MINNSNSTIRPGIFDNENFTNLNIEATNELVKHVATCIIISIGLPLTLVTIYALYSLVRKDHVAPIYVINLLITDFFQLCCIIVFESQAIFPLLGCMYSCLILTSVGFMVCVSLERYLVIAHPLWYRFRRNIKITVAVCVIMWIMCPVFYITVRSLVFARIAMTIFSVFFIIPFPLFIFFLVGTLRALSTSVSVSSEEKQRIVGIQVLVLFIYMFLFLPSIIFFLKRESGFNDSLYDLSFMCAKLSPLADVALYIFIRKDSVGQVLAASCCCKIESNDNRVSGVNVV